jgi:ParE toxin of type II toxin-antitoxin system, parDE
MKYKTIIQLEAAQDFKEAKLFYKRTKVNGLSLRFTNAVKTTISNLQKHPAAYAIRYKNVRIAHTEKFPYAIHFFIDNDLIVITAIIYNGRDPKMTFNRV